MPRPRLLQRLHYAFDNSLAHGPIVLIAWLALVSAVFLALMTLFVWGLSLAPAEEGGQSPGPLAIAWMSLMRTLDAGTMGGDRGSWPFLLSMLVVTLGGIFVISTLIGTITSGIEEKLADLRRGRSRVLEDGHSVVLGFTPEVFTVVSELVAANQNRRDACVVVLADRDKAQMEEELRERVGDFHTTRLVCRSGRPTDRADLRMAAVDSARSVLVLPPQDATPDATVIKTLLALSGIEPSHPDTPACVVAPILETPNLTVARLAGGPKVELVHVGDLLSRITVQTSRQSGLSVVYQELLDFGGDEIYFQEEPRLVGKSFGDALLAYEDSAIIGLRSRGKGPRLLPAMDERIAPGDKLIAISADDDTVRVSGVAPRIDEGAIAPVEPEDNHPEHTLVLGWNGRAAAMLLELDQYVAAGSSVTVVGDSKAAAGEIESVRPRLQRLEVSARVGDTTDRAVLDAANVPGFDHVILLCDDTLAQEQAGAHALMTLLHLRDIRDRSGRRFSIVSELLDVRDRDLADVTRADDFIVGERLLSLLLTQVSENPELNAIFADVFDPEGAEIYLKPAARYVKPGHPVSFHTVVEAARRRGEAAIGYRLRAFSDDPGRAYGVRVNPRKSEPVTFSEDDRIVVVAES